MRHSTLRLRRRLVSSTLPILVLSGILPVTPAVAAPAWSAPTITYAANDASSLALTVSWTPHTDTTAKVSTYVATAVSTLPEKSTTSCPAVQVGSQNKCVLILPFGSSAQVSVAAKSSTNVVLQSTSTTNVQITAPSAPSELTLTGGDSRITATWKNSTPAQVPPVTGYTVEYQVQDSAAWMKSSCSGTVLTCVINNLQNLQNYSVRVTAKNLVGTATSASGIGAPFKLQPALRVSATNGGNSSIRVTWDAASGKPSVPAGVFTYQAFAKQGLISPISCPSTTALNCEITGLTPGEAYAVWVVATWNGQTVQSIQPDPTVTVFNAPSGVVVTTLVGSTPGSQNLKVSWTPGSSNGASMTTYTVRLRDVTAATAQSTICTVDATKPSPVLECQVTGLINGDTYEVQVIAANGLTSTFSTSTVPFGPPSGPRNVTVSGGAGSGKLTVSWTPPTNSGGTNILKYVATALDQSGGSVGNCVALAPATTCQVGGLTNGVTFSARVVAINGPSETAGFTSLPGAASNSAVVYGPPSSVRNLLAQVGHVAGSGTIVVTWDGATESNGMDITGYRATITNQSRSAPGQSCVVAVFADFTCSFTGLTNGDSYLVSVVAVNGQDSAASTVVAVPYTAPGNAVAPTLTGGFDNYASGKLLISWGAADRNGSDVSYTVTVYDEGNQKAGTCLAGVTSAVQISCTVSGLSDGKFYTAVIVASNGIDSTSTVVIGDPALVFGPPSVAQNPAVAAGPSPGSGKLTVSWSAPASNNGRNITKYVVWASTAGSSATKDATCQTGATVFQCTLSGLTNGVFYNIQVLSYNGLYTYSAKTLSGTPFIEPDKVSGISVQVGSAVGSQKMKVTWSAPANNGKAITGYVVTALSSGGGVRTCTPVAVQVLSCTFAGLQNGATYNVTITASNDTDSSSTSTQVAGTPYGPPSAPESGVVVTGAVAGSQKLNVSWSAPTSDGGRNVDRYVVRAVAGGTVAGTCAVGGQSSSCVIVGLVNGTDYSISISAYNNFIDDVGSAGTYTFDEKYHPYTRPGSPTSLTGDVGYRGGGSGKLKATWSVPSSNGGNAITRYVATASPGGQSCSVATATATSCTISGLANGVSYSIQVVAQNGENSVSDATSSPVQYSPYGPPSAVRTVSWSCILGTGTKSLCASGELIATWVAPSVNNGRALTEYRISLTDVTSGGTPAQFTTTPSVLLYDFKGLVNGHQYQLEVKAVNGDQSVGAAGTPPATANPFTVPSPPTIASVTVPAGEPGSLVVTWTRKADDDGGSPISSFRAQAKIGLALSGSPCNVTGSATNCTIRGLQNGISYLVQMIATNAAGSSASSLSSLAVKPNGPPSGPVSVEIFPAPNYLSAQVKNLNMGGGLPDAKYEIRWDIAIDAISPCWLPINYSVRGSTNPSNCSRENFPVDFSASTSSCPSTYSSYGQTPTCTVNSLNQGVGFVVRATVQNQYTVDNPPSPSWKSVAVVLTDVPRAPQEVAVVTRGSVATISWSKPLSDGGSPILKYQVTSDPSGLQCEVVSPSSNSDAYQCQISGLTLGLSYTFSVVAINISGSSAATNSELVVIGAASAPSAVVAYPINGGILVSWTQAESNGFPITLYTATARSGSKSAQCSTGAGTTPTLSCVIKVDNCPLNLSNCPTNYQVSVTAQNVVGGIIRTSAATAAEASVAVYGVPGKPTGVTVVSLESSLVVSWTAPETIGSGISMFVVTAVDQQKGAGSFYCTYVPGVSKGNPNSCSLGNGSMQLGHSFNVSVQAFGDVGGGDSSSIVVATTSQLPIAPTRVVVNAQASDLIVQWTPYEAKGANRATSYRITSSPVGATCGSPALSSGTVCTGIVPGLAYSFSIIAVNGSGSSAPRQSSAASLSSSLTQTGSAPSASDWIQSGGPSVLPTSGSVAFAGSTMYTISRFSGQIFVTSSGVTSAIALSQQFDDPSSIAVSADGTKLFVADAGANAILTLGFDGSNVRTLSMTGLSVGLNDPEGLILVGSTLYVADSGNGRIVAVPATGGAAKVVSKWSGLIAPTALGALASGDLLVVDSGSRQIYQINPLSGSVATFSLYDPNGLMAAPTPTAVSVSSDGGTVFVGAFSSDGTSSIFEMTSSGGEVKRVVSESFGIGGVAISPQGKLTYVGVRGVFTTQFRMTPMVPKITLQPQKNGVLMTWSANNAWDSPWSIDVKVAPASSPTSLKSCVANQTGCSIASGLAANTKYKLFVTVTGASGTSPAVATLDFQTKA